MSAVTSDERSQPKTAAFGGELRMTPRQRWISLIALVGVFLFVGDSPFWNHPFDVDLAAWSSYLPIPIIVLGCLLYSRRLSGVAFFLNTMELTLLKFGITYAIATTLWALAGAPPPRASSEAVTPAAMPARSAPPADVEIVFGDGEPRDATVQVGAGQRVAARSSDGTLHVIVAEDRHGVRRTVPLLASGAAHVLDLSEMDDEVTLRCSLHPHAARVVLAD